MEKLRNVYSKAPAVFSLVLCFAIVLGSFAVWLGIGLLPRGARLFDTTDNGIYTLRPETLGFLSELDCDVEIKLVSETGIPEYGVPEALIRSYAEKNRRIKFSTVSPDEVLATHGVLNEGCAIVKSEARETVIYSSDYFDLSKEGFDMSVNTYYYLADRLSQQYGINTYADFMYSGFGESLGLFDIAKYQRTITNAIRYVSADDVTLLFSVTDHGESVLDPYLYPEFRNTCTELLFGKLSEGIPENADGVLINNPQSDITEEEKATLTDYLAGGGRITLITSFAYVKKLPVLLSVCEAYGLTTDGGLLCEDDKDYHYGEYVEATHPKVNVDAFGGYLDGAALKPLAMGGTGITVTEKEGITVTSLMNTSENAYAKIEKSEEEGKAEEENADGSDEIVRKQYSTAAIAKNAAGGSILWLPTFAFSDSMYDTFAERHNFPVFIAALGAQYGSDKPIDIEGVSLALQPLKAPEAAFPVGMVIFILIPCVILALGGIIIVKRRNRAYRIGRNDEEGN